MASEVGRLLIDHLALGQWLSPWPLALPKADEAGAARLDDDLRLAVQGHDAAGDASGATRP